MATMSIKYDNYVECLSTGLASLLESEAYTNMTIAVEGNFVKAHQLLLSIYSPYFKSLLTTIPSHQHPIIFLQDMRYDIIKYLMEFMYKGRVEVPEEEFEVFTTTAAILQIKGLSDIGKSYKKRKLDTPVQRIEIASDSQYDTSFCASDTSMAAPDDEEEDEESDNDKSELKPKLQIKEEYSELNQEVQELTAVETSSCIEHVEGDPFHDFVPVEEEEDSAVEDIVPSASRDQSPLPMKSRKLYEKAYDDFSKWCMAQGVRERFTEENLLVYFTDISKHYKASSLWTLYSKLRATLLSKQNIDISKFSRLLTLLKRKADGYQPKKSKILSREHMLKFIAEAPDDVYLMNKVAIIMGIGGSMHCQELLNLSVRDIEDKGDIVIVRVRDSKTDVDRYFHIMNSDRVSMNSIEMYKRYAALRPVTATHDRFFVNYRNGKCSSQAVGKNTLGKIPMAVAEYLKLPDPGQYTGHSLRRSSASSPVHSSSDILSVLRHVAWKAENE